MFSFVIIRLFDIGHRCFDVNIADAAKFWFCIDSCSFCLSAVNRMFLDFFHAAGLLMELHHQNFELSFKMDFSDSHSIIFLIGCLR